MGYSVPQPRPAAVRSYDGTADGWFSEWIVPIATFVAYDDLSSPLVAVYDLS